ncbi:hypothetical protein ACLB2K_076993 [Fragaria x ananassa]
MGLSHDIPWICISDFNEIVANFEKDGETSYARVAERLKRAPYSSSLSTVQLKTRQTAPGSFVLTGLVEAAAGPYLGFSIQDLSLDEKAEFLLVAQGGKILHIDFGDCFEASMNREKFPEKVINVAAFQVSQFLFIKFGVCQPAVPPQEQPR